MELQEALYECDWNVDAASEKLVIEGRVQSAKNGGAGGAKRKDKQRSSDSD